MTTIGAAIGKAGREAMRAAARRETRTRYAPINFKAEADEDGRLFFEGMANTVNPDRVNEVVNPKAFEKSARLFMKYNPQMFYNHDWSLSVGSFTDYKVTEDGLWVRGYVQPATDDEGEPLTGEFGDFIRMVRGQVKRGQIRTLSIGFRLLDSKDMKFTDPMTGKESKGREVTNLELLEVSLVTVPANRESAIEVRNIMQAMYGEDVAKSLVPDDAGNYLKSEMGEAEPDSVIDRLRGLGFSEDEVEAIALTLALKNLDTIKDGDTVSTEAQPEPTTGGNTYKVRRLIDEPQYKVRSLFAEDSGDE